MKNCHFSKRVNKWFLDKNGHFCNFFILSKIGQENVCYDILERKNPFLGFKNKKFKKSKNCNYSKWVTNCFCTKNDHFSNFFFFRQYRPGKCLLQYSRTKKRLSRPKKQKDQTVKKIDIFPKGLTHSFGPKIAIFQTFFFEPNRPVKCLLRYSRIQNTPFYSIKTRSLKSEKIAIFPKGLTHGFGPKMVIFSTFFFRQYRPGKCVLRYLRTKEGLSRL